MSKLNRTEKKGLSFIIHGSIDDDTFFIVPDGYTVTFFTKSNELLDMEDFLDEYYKYNEINIYKHIRKPGEVVRNASLTLSPFFNQRQKFQNLFVYSYTNYTGPLPSVLGFEKIPELAPINNLLPNHPIFANVDYKTNPEKYKQYLDIYKYLKKPYRNRLDKIEIFKNFFDKYKSKNLAELLEDEDKYKEFKNYYFTIASKNAKQADKEKGDIIEEINKKNAVSKLLFDDVSKNDESKSKLTEIFSKVDNKTTTIDILQNLQPGDYNFYVCRIFNAQLKKDIIAGTKIGLLSRRKSITNNNNTKDKTTASNFKHFGGINGKIVIIARFCEYIIKTYSLPKYKKLIESINNESSHCQTFSFYHNLIVDCSQNHIKCSQLITESEKQIIEELISNVRISESKICKLLNPNPKENLPNTLKPRLTNNAKTSFLKGTKRNQYLNFIKKTRKHLANVESRLPTPHPKLYSDKINIVKEIDTILQIKNTWDNEDNEDEEDTNIAKNIAFVNDRVISLNITEIHSINNVILIIYAFIKNILLNKEFKKLIVSKLLYNNKEQIDPQIKDELNLLFSPEKMLELLIVSTEETKSMSILEYFETVLNVQDKSYFESD